MNATIGPFEPGMYTVEVYQLITKPGNIEPTITFLGSVNVVLSD
jgi:hypothetical protein